MVNFDDAGALGRIIVNEGVSTRMVEMPGGGHALEVHVAPFATHNNYWPYIVLGPELWGPPEDYSHYSRLTTTIRNMSTSIARVNVQYSTLVGDGGRNQEGELTVIPAGTVMNSNVDTASFEINDPSELGFLYFIFPPLSIDAVYRIEGVDAVYDPVQGSPAEKLQTGIAALPQQLKTVEARMNWKAIPVPAQQGWRDRIAAMETQVAKLEAEYRDASTAPSFVGKFRPLQVQMSELSRNMGTLILADKKDFFAWKIDPYINILRTELPGLNNEPLNALDTRMALNEFRDNVFMVSSCGRNLRLGVTVRPSRGLPAKALLMQETIYLKDRRGEETGDGIYPLEGTLTVPRGESRQLRLRFDTRYSGLKPGNYSYQVLLRDLDTGTVKAIPGSLQVWNFSLPSPDILTNNSYAEFDQSEFRDGELLRKAVQEMKPYGLNLVSVHPAEMPHAVGMDANGNIREFDGAVFEKRIRGVQEAWNAAPGTDKLRFMFSLSALSTPEWSQGLISAEVPYGSPQWKRAFGQWFRNFTGTVRKLGIADEDWILNLGDESSEAALTGFEIPLGEMIKEMNPRIRLVCNTSTQISDPANSARFFKVFDIMQPNLSYGTLNPALLEWMRSGHKELWTYKCDSDLAVRDKNTYDYYRVYGWRMVQEGMTGIGIWTYCAQSKSPYLQPNNGFDLIFKHQTKDEVVHHCRYEMYREGADDYRYIQQLREAANQRGAKAQTAAERLISSAIWDITANTTDTSRCEKWRLQIAAEILKLQKQPLRSETPAPGTQNHSAPANA